MMKYRLVVASEIQAIGYGGIRSTRRICPLVEANELAEDGWEVIGSVLEGEEVVSLLMELEVKDA